MVLLMESSNLSLDFQQVLEKLSLKLKNNLVWILGGSTALFLREIIKSWLSLNQVWRKKNLNQLKGYGKN